MKLLFVALLVACAATLIAAQWSNTDHEIFDIQAALEKDEGAGTNFYSIMNLTKGASADAIKKAYRKTSMRLHPDKNPNNATTSRRFERLGVINKILRDERRDRYDHFLTNGFPRWRGSGYYYARFRPGLGMVLTFLVLVTASIQLLVKRLNHARDKSRMEALQTSARLNAWGPRFRSIEAGLRQDNLQEHNKNVIVAAEKKVKIPLAGIEVPPLATLKATDNEKDYWDEDEKAIRKAMSKSASHQHQGDCCDGPRRTIDALVTKEMVFVMPPGSKEWMPLDEGAAPRPTAKDTWPFAIVYSILNSIQGTKGGGDEVVETGDEVVAAIGTPNSKKSKKKKQQ